MITIKGYAEKKGVSYEAIRSQIKRYEKELGDGIFKKGRTTFINEDAERFLDERRKENPVVIVQENKSEELEMLKNEKVNMLAKIAELQELLLAEKDKTLELTTERTTFLEDKKMMEETKTRNKILEDEKLAQDKIIEERDAELKSKDAVIDKFKNASFGARLFGFKKLSED